MPGDPTDPTNPTNPADARDSGDASEPGYRPPDLGLLGPDHVRRYQETGGEVGYLWNGIPTLLLTTTGRRTGEPRTSALIFGRDGDRYLVVASSPLGDPSPLRRGRLGLRAHVARRGLTVCSADSDFARFPDLRWENPLAG